ncbi:hypothetical protein HG535_0E03650 [Zygotorulaspora mrakii]|uniref:Peroxin/Ferlin domain-containing protein n=1 Tax=Zygotorulaspora mrakii TaxID=42260 RepID=A0A7H9B3P5_ZYGMR|nr:uncharacterized protein HG535_0E03650 [Zygotorulaspora mrakii]QLG73281.1 hypothetical protein HG535_0E03650 [Zygotorulaspora mrakii]
MADTSTKQRETRAQFVDEPETRIGGDTTKVIRSAMKKRQESSRGNNNDDDATAIVSSPLLTSTPPTISKALVKLYPHLIVADRFLTLVTWSGEDIWPSILMVILYVTLLLYFEKITTYFGHLAIVAVIWGYSLLDKHVEETLNSRPTLDDIVHTMKGVITKADMLLSPITVLSAQDIRKFLFTTAFLSPVYIIITLFILPPRKFLLFGGVYLLTYNSPWSMVTRTLLWRFKFVRLLIFYVTGLDSGGINKNQGIFAAVQKQVKKLSTGSDGATVEDGKPIRFTYVLYENQRRWLGIGWTSSMLSYERASWTDEFLNEAPSPDNFKLPEESSGMLWKWVDKTWRLDMTNDGAIQLSSARPKTTASPNADDGFIYYDNTWKKPTTEDSFSKYTRRRRWIRTAELMKTSSFGLDEIDTTHNVVDNSSGSNHKRVVSQNSVASTVPKSETDSDPDSATATGSRRRVSFSEVDNVHIIPSDDDADTDTDQKDLKRHNQQEDYSTENPLDVVRPPQDSKG